MTRDNRPIAGTNFDNRPLYKSTYQANDLENGTLSTATAAAHVTLTRPSWANGVLIQPIDGDLVVTMNNPHDDDSGGDPPEVKVGWRRLWKSQDNWVQLDDKRIAKLKLAPIDVNALVLAGAGDVHFHVTWYA